MQSLISANQKSLVETTMVESGGSDVPYYSDPASFPELGIQFQSTSPYITIPGAAANGSMVFKLPSGAGFLYDASVGFVCTSTVNTADIEFRTGYNMIRSIEWLSNGQPIVYKTGHALLAQVLTSDSEAFQKFALKYCLPLKATGAEDPSVATDTTFLTYVSLSDSFLMRPEKALLLDKIGDLQLRITFNTTLETGISTDITAITGTLYTQTYMPKLSVYNQMVAQDWSGPLQMESVNTHTEVVPLTSTSTATYTITTPFLAFKSHIFIKTVTGTSGSPFIPISSLTLVLNGIPLVSAIKPSRMRSCAAKYGTAHDLVSSTGVVTYNDNSMITIDWGVLCGRGKNSGTAFFQELQGTTITVTYAATTATDQLFLVHENFNLLNFNPGSSGQGSLSIVNN